MVLEVIKLNFSTVLPLSMFKSGQKLITLENFQVYYCQTQ